MSRLGKNDSIDGLIVDSEKPIAKIVNGEVLSIATGEKVGFMRGGYLCSLEGERLASFDALNSEGYLMIGNIDGANSKQAVYGATASFVSPLHGRRLLDLQSDPTISWPTASSAGFLSHAHY